MTVQQQHNKTQNTIAPDATRRHFLTIATATAAVAGVGFAAYPFLASLQPSAKAAADGGPVQVDLRAIQPGERITVTWRGKPVWIVRRTPESLQRLQDPRWQDELRDPDASVATQQPGYAQNKFRSIREEYFVAIALCTHLGCVPLYEPQPDSTRFSKFWIGGFFCPCHGSRFDLAGRVIRNVPAPTNLVIPPHTFVGPYRLEIGTDHTETPEEQHGNA
jgi:ubiquinol-cytochrome c reductase iron-sulfur subunit